MIEQNRYPEPISSPLIPWHAFPNAQAAYDWAASHVKGFNYGVVPGYNSDLYCFGSNGKSFYTDFMSADGRELEVLRLWVKP